ncbi:MAG: alanine:cation symporter family protein, partial [Ruminococcus sp.]|nr:alanine:cation symporter family protein [Ruminococcus sp.]
KGVARGIFSNEAGLGSAPIAAAAANTNEPARQGLVTMTGTFIDTIIVCTMTGLSIIISGCIEQNPEFEGVAITDAAFRYGLPFPEKVSSFLLMICLMFFAFTTILGWNYYSERCLSYLTGSNKTITIVFRVLYILAVFIAPYLAVSAVWNISDIFNGLMALPNITALIALSGVTVKETESYFRKLK